MKWNYRCPICFEWRMIEWGDLKKRHICHRTQTSYTMPRPADQDDAYVDTHNWPQEMEDAVTAIKGTKCTAYNCDKDYETLDHNYPWSKKGRTCMSNLNPMCNKHNLEKSDKDPSQWMFDQIADEIINDLS